MENHDFLEAVWYRREVEIPREWGGRRVLLHFEAVDYDATVWVNGEEVGCHRGGFSPFTCDVSDEARSYAGLRSVAIDGKAITLNGQPNPSAACPGSRLLSGRHYDGALRREIELSMEAGFNGARLHQKVFEERFLYHADRLGYLVWGEFGDWGCRGYGTVEEHQQPTASYITEWLEVLERDYSHPSIVGWCPLNETSQPQHDRITTLDAVTRGLYLATKATDRTRPVLDTSGYSHRVPEADVYNCHDYTQDPDTFAGRHAHVADGNPYYNGRDGQIWSIPL